MEALLDKRVLVVGLGKSGEAACRLLRQRGALVVAVDQQLAGESWGPKLASLSELGVETRLGVTAPVTDLFDLIVVSPGVDLENPILAELRKREVPVIGELELAFQQAFCLNIAITGTNGKTTTTELITQLLNGCHRPTLAAGNIGTPFSSVVEATRNLDFVTLEVSSFQLETIHYFRPSIAVFLNLTPDHLDRHPNMEAYLRAKARIFENQQAFDWAIVQHEALEQIKKLGIRIPGKLITFSAEHRKADLIYDRGLLVSRIEDWQGPLLNMEHCRLIGPHNAENMMAALAVAKVLRLPLERAVEIVKEFRPAPHRCELVAEINGVRFINDSKSTNVDALRQALKAVPNTRGAEPNVWLIAGGKDKGFEFHDVAPIVAQRVKGAFLIGETREKIRAAWGLFTPCTLKASLLEAFNEAATRAAPGDVVLLSPACSSFDQFQNYQHRGEVFRELSRIRKELSLEEKGSGAAAPNDFCTLRSGVL